MDGVLTDDVFLDFVLIIDHAGPYTHMLCSTEFFLKNRNLKW